MSKLTGGNWEARANEYWKRWHRSAFIAGEYQMRAERAEQALRKISDLNVEDEEFTIFGSDAAESALDKAQDIAYAAITGRGTFIEEPA